MSISKLIRGDIEVQLMAWRSELIRIQESQGRIPELQALIAEAEALIASADAGVVTQVTVAAREKADTKPVERSSETLTGVMS